MRIMISKKRKKKKIITAHRISLLSQFQILQKLYVTSGYPTEISTIPYTLTASNIIMKMGKFTGPWEKFGVSIMAIIQIERKNPKFMRELRVKLVFEEKKGKDGLRGIVKQEEEERDRLILDVEVDSCETGLS